MADVDSAISLYGLALDFRSTGHPKQPIILLNIFKALHLRFILTGDPEDRGRTSACKQAAQCPSSDQFRQPHGLYDVFNAASLAETATGSLCARRVKIEVVPLETIQQLKRMVEDKIAVPVREHKLFYADHLLLDERTIQQCVPDTSGVINVVCCVRPIEKVDELFPLINMEMDILFREALVPTTKSQGKRPMYHVVDPLSTPSDHDGVLQLVTPGIAREAYSKEARDSSQIVEMGFPYVDVEAAMSATDFNPDLAVEYLLNYSYSIPPSHGPLEGVDGESPNIMDSVIGDESFKSNDPGELSMAIECFELTLESRPAGHPDHSSALNDLAAALNYRFEESGDRADLDTAIGYFEDALQLLSPTHEGRSDFLYNLAVTITNRFRLTGDRKDVEVAIRFHQDALRLRPLGHPHRSSSLHQFGSAVYDRAEQTKDLVDIDKAIEYYRDALSLRPNWRRDHPANLNGLGLAMFVRCGLTKEYGDLDTVIAYYKEALQLRPPGDPGRSINFDNLGVAMNTRFMQGGNRLDLDMAIEYYEDATAFIS
ncbi:hypothetical protein FRB96_000508 [Tulasnella sp. 330]|nr:hypothetical protein FRB96_000508 [Tulasnella sp. 330]